MSHLSTFKVMILWHAQFFGLPIIEIIVTIAGIIGGLLVGYTSHGALVEHFDVDYVPTRDMIQSTYYMAACMLCSALILSLGVAHVCCAREADLVRNFNSQGRLRSSSYIITTLVRSMVSSIILTFCWIPIFLLTVEGTGSNTAMIIANFSVFLTMWTYLCSFICSIVAPVAYSAHVLIYVTVVTMLLSGNFSTGNTSLHSSRSYITGTLYFFLEQHVLISSLRILTRVVSTMTVFCIPRSVHLASMCMN